MAYLDDCILLILGVSRRLLVVGETCKEAAGTKKQEEGANDLKGSLHRPQDGTPST
ncbi:hypothetical protein DF3PB_1820008 [uncultured Defluviicoccus sp.]|uniref:Uncharacterized protein n=1 Tax=metagenome TaxID=256318 RepID=A0A380TAE0_9ZZZZ|nr:hypothetical protein DF3PB_1820008 [uncultured Defluviicoccus sp.]